MKKKQHGVPGTSQTDTARKDKTVEPQPGEPDQSRRSRLALLVGSAVVAGTAGHWVKPVVRSVTLPAHAQTSAPTGGPMMCQPLVIPATSLPCDGGAAASLLFRVDDSGACPVLLSLPGPSTAVGVDLLQDIEITLTPAPIPILASRVNVRVAGFNREASLTCANGTGIDAASQSFPFTASSTATWNATYAITTSMDGITVSDIVLAPGLP